MTKDIIKFSILFIMLLLVQILICNHIAIFNVAIPIVFIYFIIRLPISMGNGWLFTLSFLMGFIIDIFSDTPGINSLASTLLAGMKKPAFYAYVPKDDKTKHLTPSISSLGLKTYCKFLITMVGLYCAMVFCIEYFNFADVKEIVILSASSCLLSFMTLLAIDCLNITKT